MQTICAATTTAPANGLPLRFSSRQGLGCLLQLQRSPPGSALMLAVVSQGRHAIIAHVRTLYAHARLQLHHGITSSQGYYNRVYTADSNPDCNPD